MFLIFSPDFLLCQLDPKTSVDVSPDKRSSSLVACLLLVDEWTCSYLDYFFILLLRCRRCRIFVGKYGSQESSKDCDIVLWVGWEFFSEQCQETTGAAGQVGDLAK
jgi:hypothetical protein